MMKRLAVATMMFMASCTATFQSVVPELQSASSSKMQCPPREIRIAERQAPGDMRPMLHWRAEGCGRQYDCSGNRNVTECTETAASEAQTLESVVIDRLALETGCAVPDIRVMSQASWVNGQERAYRLRACGRVYVCNAAPGRPTACKEALAQ